MSLPFVFCVIFFHGVFVLSSQKKLLWEARSTQSFVCSETIYYSFLVSRPENAFAFFSFPFPFLLVFVASSQQVVSLCLVSPTFFLSWFFAFWSYCLLVLNFCWFGKICNCSWCDFCSESSISPCWCSVPGGVHWSVPGCFNRFTSCISLSTHIRVTDSSVSS